MSLRLRPLVIGLLALIQRLNAGLLASTPDPPAWEPSVPNLFRLFYRVAFPVSH